MIQSYKDQHPNFPSSHVHYVRCDKCGALSDSSKCCDPQPNEGMYVSAKQDGYIQTYGGKGTTRPGRLRLALCKDCHIYATQNLTIGQELLLNNSDATWVVDSTVPPDELGAILVNKNNPRQQFLINYEYLIQHLLINGDDE